MHVSGENLLKILPCVDPPLRKQGGVYVTTTYERCICETLSVQDRILSFADLIITGVMVNMPPR